MSRMILTAALGGLMSVSAFAQNLNAAGFQNHFNVIKDDQGQVSVIKLKRATKLFTLKPFIQQIVNDLKGEQAKMAKMTDSELEAEVDQLLENAGYNPYSLAGEQGAEESRNFKASILNIRNIDVDATFAELDVRDFWAEFEAKLNEAFLFLDPSVLTNNNDARFFYKKNVTYKVVTWALEQAKKRFANVPVLNIASFVIVRIHDMMLEQRHFHHNMLLHYFENVSEADLGMTKSDVDRAVSSIYEYRIEATAYTESNRAAANWANYGMNNFYQLIRTGNNQVSGWTSGMSTLGFTNVKKINFGFAEVSQNDVRKIYHLHHKAHQFSGKPSLAFDYSKPNQVKRNRSLMNLGCVALGFINIPGGIKNAVENFVKSMYVQQVRAEGALVGYFETSGNTEMKNSIYAQRSNLYIIE
jgi:hypothetical protein